ncbi:MAG: hypothetical protein Ct9H90mP16_15930 [Candidatus Poseidoniales archaeon]|nr:MAG: hypothetical protein Ct9H90mP16_15930 [Candidatus Poseidoniales archaeon]
MFQFDSKIWAGRKGHFDLAEQYGIDAKIVEAMDITTSLAVAAVWRPQGCRATIGCVEQINKAGKRLFRIGICLIQSVTHRGNFRLMFPWNEQAMFMLRRTAQMKVEILTADSYCKS